MADEDKLKRVVAARAALRERFEAKMRSTPSMSDTNPEGTGPKNRHGMPKLPVGQVETKKWPVLDLGVHPEIPTDKWTLTVDGECESKVVLDWRAFMALEQVKDTSDFHCVTTWSRMDIPWEGVRLRDVIALASPRPEAQFVLFHAYDGYTTNISLEEALKPDVLLAHHADGRPLAVEHGGPVRIITPELYAWKGAKWVRRVELLPQNRPGFWEERGYSNTAYPWRNDRYG
jgi:DMSO/TMAO reductase YedYZ molybdopterin-dependent catalytic subunit